MLKSLKFGIAFLVICNTSYSQADTKNITKRTQRDGLEFTVIYPDGLSSTEPFVVTCQLKNITQQAIPYEWSAQSVGFSLRLTDKENREISPNSEWAKWNIPHPSGMGAHIARQIEPGKPLIFKVNLYEAFGDRALEGSRLTVKWDPGYDGGNPLTLGRGLEIGFALPTPDPSSVTPSPTPLPSPITLPFPLTFTAKTPEELMAAFRAALQEKSPEKLDALTYSVGMRDEDKKEDKHLQQTLMGREITSISLKPFPEDLPVPLMAIVQGQKMELTYPPTGLIEVKYKESPADGPGSTRVPYGVINGRYLIVSSKSADLGWKGPPDKELIFKVMGRGKNKVQVKVRWNASGVDQERTFKTEPFNLTGQYFDEVTVISTEDDTDVTLMILEAGKQIFVSEPLKGKGTLEYKKKS